MAEGAVTPDLVIRQLCDGQTSLLMFVFSSNRTRRGIALGPNFPIQGLYAYNPESGAERRPDFGVFRVVRNCRLLLINVLCQPPEKINYQIFLISNFFKLLTNNFQITTTIIPILFLIKTVVNSIL